MQTMSPSFFQTSLVMNNIHEKAFNLLNQEMKNILSQRLLISDKKIARLILDIFNVCQPTAENQKFFIVLLNQVDHDVSECLEKILTIARKGYAEEFFNFTKSKKTPYHSKQTALEITRLFHSAIHQLDFSLSQLTLPAYDEGGKEKILHLKASRLSVKQPYSVSSVLMKTALLDSHSSFHTKQSTTLDCLKSLSDEQRLPIEIYEAFFKSLQKDYHLKFENDEKVELIKLVFDCTTSTSSKSFSYSTEDLAEFLQNALSLKECYGTDGLLLYCSSITLRTETSFEDVIRSLKLLVECENVIDCLDLLDRFSSDSLSFSELLEMLGNALAQSGLNDSHFNEDMQLRIERFLTDNHVAFPLSTQQLDLIGRQYDQVQQFCKKYQNFNLTQLMSIGNDIRKNAMSGCLSEEERIRLLAIGRLAIRLHFGIYPHSTQMFTIFGLFIEEKNWLAQVKTGEGKSIIIALATFVITMQNRAVDIITSSRYLSIRDCNKFNYFFKKFGISSSHICQDDQKPEHFQGQILYGTVTDFEFAYMRDLLNSTGLYKERSKYVTRNFDCVLVDEADNLLMDTATNSARLSYPSEEAFYWIYAPILKFAKTHFPSVPEKSSISDSTLFQLKEFICEYASSFRENPLENIPDETLLAWLESTFQVLFHKQENRHYVIKKKKNLDGKFVNSVQIVDAGNTGRIMESSRWSNGVHEFTEIKHDIDVEKESLVPISLSHAVFYGFYRTILGLSGTLGFKGERQEMDIIYHIGSFDVPPHFPSQRIDFPIKILATDREYFQEVLGSILSCQSQGRPVLVLCATIQDSQEFADFLLTQDIEFQILNEMQEEKENVIISRAGFPGAVTIATNTASRGTDILLSEASLNNGGLHVVVTFYPDSHRVRDQAIGRAGRGGQPGSSEIFLSAERGKVKKYANMHLSNEALLEQLEQESLNAYLHMQQVRISQSELERLSYLYTERFFTGFQKWCEAINQESYLDYHSIRLSKLRLLKKQEVNVDLKPQEKTIAEQSLLLLHTPREEKIDPIKWKRLLKLTIERIKVKTLTDWSIKFYQKMQNSIIHSPSPQHFEGEIQQLFDNHKDSWEKYTEVSGNGIFTLLHELIGINFMEKSRK